jgi:Raf kinase inhibitor-like YbhB/YbcL family protein
MTKFTLTSSAFEHGKNIPLECTHTECGGRNVSPQLEWHNPPPMARSFVLIVDDPDAKPFHDGKTFYHWILLHIPATIKSFPENAELDASIKPMTNDYGFENYGGPCPPKGSGIHHYHFRLFAIDEDIPAEFTDTIEHLREYLDDAKNTNVLGKTDLVGTYIR